MLERLFALETFGIKLGLLNIERLCEALDHPERTCTTVHVAGTNGKGSVTAMVHAGLRAAGIRAGRYTSPHLTGLADRFVLDNDQVDPAALQDAARLVLDVADDLVARHVLPAPPTFFEATTAMAFVLFREAGIRVAVVEVGLGGRFDATTVVSPAVSVITSIGMDHHLQLDTTRISIATEKAGILKPGIPVVIGPLAPDAEAVVRRIAAGLGAPVMPAYDNSAVGIGYDGDSTVLRIRTPAREYPPLTLALRGDHQIDNAIVALRAMEALETTGMALSPEAISRGLSDVVWPGRLELFDAGDEKRLLLDAAHNRDGAEALARHLTRWHPTRPPLVFATMRDKDATRMLRALLPAVGDVTVTAPDTSRAADPTALAEEIQRLSPDHVVHVEPEPHLAVRRALERAPLVCVAGSIFLVGAIRGAFGGHAILK